MDGYSTTTYEVKEPMTLQVWLGTYCPGWYTNSPKRLDPKLLINVTRYTRHIGPGGWGITAELEGLKARVECTAVKKGFWVKVR